MKQCTRLTIYWPGLDNEHGVTKCQAYLPSHPREPLISKPRPTHKRLLLSYLIFVNCFTDWPTVVPMGKNATALDTITATRELFSRTAVPNMFWLEGGPQFTSHRFQIFATW